MQPLPAVRACDAALPVEASTLADVHRVLAIQPSRGSPLLLTDHPVFGAPHTDVHDRAQPRPATPEPVTGLVLHPPHLRLHRHTSGLTSERHIGPILSSSNDCSTTSRPVTCSR